jgi:hypothetical protein
MHEVNIIQERFLCNHRILSLVTVNEVEEPLNEVNTVQG